MTGAGEGGGAGRPRLVALGTVALDTVETPAGRAEEAPGGSAPYFAAAARRWGAVALVGVAGEDLPERALAPLAEAGVDLSGIRRLPGRTFRWAVRYDEEGRRTGLGSGGRKTAEGGLALPSRLRDADALFLGSTDPADQRSVLESAGRPGLVALDSMAHWIRDGREAVEALAGRVDLLFVTGEELAALGGDGDEGAAAARVLALGVPWVVVKRGARGAAAYAAARAAAAAESPAVEVPAAPAAAVVDPTGAGDAFAGGVVGVLARAGGRAALSDPGAPRAVAAALRAGAAMGARAVETFSYDGLMREVDG